MRADQHIHLPAGERGPHRPPLRCALAPFEQSHLHPARGQLVDQPQIVLIGEHLCGRHEGGLAALLHRPQHAVRRHHGLPRPHVPMEQPSHGHRALQIRVEFGYDPPLCFCGPVGKAGQEARRQGPRRREGPGLLLPVLGLPSAQHGQLEQQKLLEGQPFPGDGRFFETGREVAAKDRLPFARIAAAGQHLRRQRVEEVLGQRRGLVQDGADGPDAEVRRAGVDWHQTEDMPAFVRGTDDLMPFDQKDGAPPLPHQYSPQQDLRSLPEGRLQVGLVVPDGQRAPGDVADHRLQHLHPAPRGLSHRA